MVTESLAEIENKTTIKIAKKGIKTLRNRYNVVK